jgi:HlyD family secretion protein
VASAAGDLTSLYEVSEADIMAAEATLVEALEQQESAHNTWVRLADCETSESGVVTCVPSDGDRMEAATEDVRAAEAQVAIAQAQLNAARDPDANDIASAEASLAAAVAQVNAARARHEALLLGATDAEIAAAEADLASAKASMTSLLEGPSDTDIAVYQIRLAQAEISLQEARNALGDATLVAPFDGVVTAVHVSQGEQASGVAVEMVDTSSFELVLEADEVDIGQLEVGQTALVTLETWPDAEIDCVVSTIAPSATESGNGVTSYEVRLALDQTELPIRVGMTANAAVVTDHREGVLLVPNAAITADRQAGTYMVNLVSTDAGGTSTIDAVEVTVGLKDDEYTEVTSGLTEGDEVLLGELISAPVDDGGFRPGRGLRG